MHLCACLLTTTQFTASPAVSDIDALLSWNFNPFSCVVDDLFGHLTTMFRHLNLLEV
jgi:hypothetical protein